MAPLSFAWMPVLNTLQNVRFRNDSGLLRAQIFSAQGEYLIENIDWLEEQIGEYEDGVFLQNV